MLRAALLTEAGRIVEAQRVLAAAPEACGPLPVFVARALALLRWRCAELLADVDLMASQETVLEAAGFGVEVDMLQVCEETIKGDGRQTTAKIKQLVDALTPTDAIFAATGAAAGVVLALREGDRSSARAGVRDLLRRVAPQRILQAMTDGARSEPAFLELLAEESQADDGHPFAAEALHALCGLRESYGARWSTQWMADRARTNRGSSPGSVRALAARSPVLGSKKVVLNGFPVRLTSREAEVLEQLALGSSYAEIGRELFITENTVKTHLTSMYRKLGVDKRSAALRVARAAGLL
jgi:DNA-binding NarL/FixJ family response regulator